MTKQTQNVQLELDVVLNATNTSFSDHHDAFISLALTLMRIKGHSQAKQYWFSGILTMHHGISGRRPPTL